jgi:hypothetical protein
MKTNRAMQIRLRYNPTGETIVWRVWREPAMFSTVTKSKAPAWCWTDNEGYTRCGPETWAMFCDYIKTYFESYDSTPLQDVS